MLGQLKCKMDDLQQIVNKISPGSVPIPVSNSTNNISLPISATDVTWFDQSNGDTHSVQQALQIQIRALAPLNLDQDQILVQALVV
jgi:hypothetical protein